MKDSSMTTELDDILTSIDDANEELCFYLELMKELSIEMPEYSREEAALIKKSQHNNISLSERHQLDRILSKERAILIDQEDMVKAYLAQCNRSHKIAKLNVH